MKIAFIILAIIVFVVIVISLLIFRLIQFGKISDYKKSEKVLSSKQFAGKSFHNYGNVEMKMDRMKIAKMVKGSFKSNSLKRPSLDQQIADKLQINFERASELNTTVTWFGHSSAMIDISGKRILLDPMLGKYASPFNGAVKRFENSLNFSDSDLKKIGKIDAIILSHDHFDHLDYKTIMKIQSQVIHFFVPLAVGAHLERWGIDSSRITEMDWWEETEFEGLQFVCTPAQHFSGRDPRYRNSSLWSSWVIKSKDKNVFFSGDSGYFEGFKQIGEKYGPFDLALLECGQYNELWHEIHMMPEETIQASLDLNSKQVLPIHNSAFSLSMHNWDEPINRAKAEAEKLGVKIVDVIAGQSFNL